MGQRLRPRRHPTSSSRIPGELPPGRNRIIRCPISYCPHRTCCHTPPTPLPTATPCPHPIDEALVALLDAPLDEPLDCPRTQAVITPAAWQPFENGLMLWRADLNLIYVIEGNNWLSPVGDRWREGDEAYDPSNIAPSGYYQPGRVFGLVWREQPGVRASLGWGLAEEVGFTTTIQEFTRGLVWYDAERGRLMILYNSGAYQLVQVAETENSDQSTESTGEGE